MSREGFIQTKMDFKLLVLYILAHAAATITFWQLLDLALCDSGVDYFTLTEVVEHLKETGHLVREGELLVITDKGRRNIEITETSLPYSVRTRCDNNLKAVNEALRRQDQVQTSCTPNEDGTCTVRLYFADETGPLLDMKLISPSKEHGEALSQCFTEKPITLYHEIMQLLNTHVIQQQKRGQEHEKERP